MDADYSQIDIRVAAELSRDPELLRVFREGEDVYNRVIQDVLHVSLDDKENPVFKEARRKAKSIALGFLCGMGAKKYVMYARDNFGLDVSDSEAVRLKNGFFRLYAGLPKWHQHQRDFSHENGFVRSLTGRIRRLPDAMLPYDCPEKGAAQRQAINTPLQSFASDLILMVAIQLEEEFGEDVQVVATVHDSILVEVHETRADEVSSRVLEIMKRPSLLKEFEIDLHVRICGNVKLGPWGNAG